MLSRTHFAIALFFVFLFLPSVSNPIVFSITLVLLSLIPDIDSPMSFLGKHKIFSVPQIFLKHRGVMHSLTLAFLLSIGISLLFPVLGLGAFLGYSVHLIVDSFTIEGIAPFWPLRGRLSWKLKTGGYFDHILFILFSFIDIILIIRYFS